MKCRCGEDHEGPYAEYDYGHHNCFHQSKLWSMSEDQVMCPDCGFTWLIEIDKTEDA